jgi:pimeloyl-ACP methyl ester carboxylesterase
MTTSYLDLPGGRIAYDDTGSGPLVVCVPGMGDVRAEYRLLAPRLLAAGYRVVTMDLRGQGESSANWPDYSQAAVGGDVVALIRALGGGPAFVVGTSYAGGAAVWAAAQAPEATSGVVLTSAFVREHGSALQQRMNALLYSVLFADPWGPAVWRAYFPTFYPTRKPDDFTPYLAGLVAMLRQPGKMRAMRRMMLSASNTESQLARVRAPALVVMGTRDPDFKPDPRAEAEWIAAHVHGTFQMIDGAGHYPQVEMPDETADAIIGFLNATTQREGIHGSTRGAE